MTPEMLSLVKPLLPRFIPDIPEDNASLFAMLYPCLVKKHPYVTLTGHVLKSFESYLNSLRRIHAKTSDLQAMDYISKRYSSRVDPYLKHTDTIENFDEFNEAVKYSFLICSILFAPKENNNLEASSGNTLQQSRKMQLEKFCGLSLDSFSDELQPELHKLLEKVHRCESVELLEEASDFTEQIFTKLIEDKMTDTQSERDQILQGIGKNNSLKSISSKGNIKRHKAGRKTKEEAVRLYFSGNFKNPSQASKRLFPEVKKIGLEFGFQFSDDPNGEITLARWLREAVKKHSQLTNR